MSASAGIAMPLKHRVWRYAWWVDGSRVSDEATYVGDPVANLQMVMSTVDLRVERIEDALRGFGGKRRARRHLRVLVDEIDTWRRSIGTAP